MFINFSVLGIGLGLKIVGLDCNLKRLSMYNNRTGCVFVCLASPCEVFFCFVMLAAA